MNPQQGGDHSFLSENTVDRVRKLAGAFIEGAQSRLRSCTFDLGSKTCELCAEQISASQRCNPSYDLV